MVSALTNPTQTFTCYHIFIDHKMQTFSREGGISKYALAFNRCWPSFSCNNLNQTFPVVADQMGKSIRMNLVSLFFTKLPLFSKVSGMSEVNSFLEVMPYHLNCFSSGLWLDYSRMCILLLWSHYQVDLLLKYGLLSCFSTHPRVRFNCVTDYLMFSCKISQ